MVFDCLPTHRLAHRKIITAADLNNENFVAFDANLQVRKAIDRCLRQHCAKVPTPTITRFLELLRQADKTD